MNNETSRHPGNIKVKFFEYYGNNCYWEAFGEFSESDVHHQYGIVFKTPAYRETQITQPVKVFVQLFRPKDKCVSDPKEFYYKPNPTSGLKRPRVESIEFIPTVVRSHEPSSQENSSSSMGSAQQSSCSQQSFGRKNTRNDHNQNELVESTMFQDKLPSYFGSFSTSQLNLTSNDFNGLLECSAEDFYSFLDINIDNNACKLQTDSVSTNTEAFHRSPSDDNCSLLDKLKVLIRLFKNNFDSDKLHEMMMVLIETQKETGENILLDCIEYGTIDEIRDVVLILVKYKLMDVLKSVNDLDQNCFHLLIIAGCSSLLKVFLNLGVDVNQADVNGQTPLHLAVLHNDQDSLKELLDRANRIRLDEVDDDGFTPLHLAVKQANVEFVKLLVKAGADVSKRSLTTGTNALQIAVTAKAVNMDLVKYLIECDEQLLHQQNFTGLNALQLASSSERPNDVTRYLENFYQESYITTHANEDDNTDSESDNENPDDEIPEPMFDERCLKELSGIFDVNDGWKGVLMLMGQEDKIIEYENDPSPSRSLFNHIEVSISSASLDF